MIPECFPQGGMTLDITEGKLFLLFDLREIQRANQEIVHARDTFLQHSSAKPSADFLAVL